MVDWSTLRNTATSTDAAMTAQDVKDRLPIAFVLATLGVPVEPADGKLVARCPFHQDDTPSFDVYGESLSRWGCYPCGAGGDVLDLIQKHYSIHTFPETIDKARELLAAMPVGWSHPEVRHSAETAFDLGAAEDFVRRSQSAEPDALYAFLAVKGAESPSLQAIPPDWLQSEFRIGCDQDQIVMPFYTADGTLTAYKYRTASTKSISAPGSALVGTYYGEWRDTDPSLPVVLCEGETDTWAAAFHLGAEYVALGLPSGAGSHPSNIERLRGREVIIAFDGDEAGRKGALTWSTTLRDAGCSVFIVPLPDGVDVASLDRPRFWLTLNRPMMPAPDGIIEEAGAYYRPHKELPIPLSNWSLDPEIELLGPEGESAYEGIMRPSGRRVTLSSFDLATKTAITQWAIRNGAAWYGSDRDAQQLLGLCQSIGPFLSPGQMATVAGLHDNHFVLPGRTIGPDNWQYVEPPNTIHLDRMMHMSGTDWSPEQVHALRGLHSRKVMDPILAWLAVAPIRSLFHQFPILAVTGSSGSGKTTLVETVLKHFSGALVTTNLTSTTPHALFSFVGATNSLPVWIDEYRPGARKATMDSLQQVIRDAYTGQTSAKGGMGRGWAEVISVSAGCPMVITGEDAFHETSHTERMVLVDLTAKGRSQEALNSVLSWGPTGLPVAYLEWLQHMLIYEQIDWTPTPIPTEGMSPRQQMNMAVLEVGWSILDEFVQYTGGDPLGDPDWGLVTGAAVEAASHNPIKDAIIWCLDEVDAASFIAAREDLVHVRVDNFVKFVENRTKFVLPGGPEAIRRYLVEHYNGFTNRAMLNGRQQRVISFSADLLGLDDG